jgi:hypothetical protein
MHKLLEQDRILHHMEPDYGASSLEYLPESRLFLDELRPVTVLDFGCGKALLIKILCELYPKTEFYGYDPAIPGRSVLSVREADFVICTDVLEHIPEAEIEGIVTALADLSDKVFFVLHHAPSVKRLPNGQNAHCTVKPAFWYWRLLEKYFEIVTPLPGRKPYTSVVCTFNITQALWTAYENLIAESHRYPIHIPTYRGTLYFDIGTGFTEEYSKPFTYTLDEIAFGIDFSDLPENIRILRIDPVEWNSGLCLESLVIQCGSDKLPFTIVNGYSIEKYIVFLTDDPQILVDLSAMRNLPECIRFTASVSFNNDVIIYKLFDKILNGYSREKQHKRTYRALFRDFWQFISNKM